MASTDLSQCLETTTGYGAFGRTLSGHVFAEFDATGNASERAYGKDPACCVTLAVFFLEYLQLGCASGGLNLYDGSGGSKILGLADACLARTETWDFRNDPLRCLTACNTQSLCVSAANGFWKGTLIGTWGTEY